MFTNLQTQKRQFSDQFAKGGIDIIKDDHGLSDQIWAPFNERVELCAQAVLRANQETGRTSLYCPCLNAPVGKLLERAYYAKQVGAGAVMILPGIAGWDIVRQLAADEQFGLPILIHPALLGGWLQSNEDDDGTSSNGHHHNHHHPHGMSHKFLFGILPRLCGGDAVIFPNAGGRFQFSHQECQQVAEGCRRPMGRFEGIFPSPAGGMKLHKVDQMRTTFGDDTLFLIGGALLEQGPDLEQDAKAFAHCAGRDGPYQSPASTTTRVSKSTPMDFPTTAENSAMKEDNAPSIADVERVAMNVRRRVLEYTLRVSYCQNKHEETILLFRSQSMSVHLFFFLSLEQWRISFPSLLVCRNTSDFVHASTPPREKYLSIDSWALSRISRAPCTNDYWRRPQWRVYGSGTRPFDLFASALCACLVFASGGSRKT